MSGANGHTAQGTELSGKVVVVTGGSRGIGRSIVMRALRMGASVAYCSRRLKEDEERAWAEEAGALESAVLAFQADVSREDDVASFFGAVVDKFDRVDAVVNNAGINQDGLLLHTSVESWDEVIRVNLTGAFLVSRQAIQEFLAQGEGGRIVSIGSLSQEGATSQASYAASKGGLIGLTRTIAKEYGRRGIYANLIVAGYVETEISSKLPEYARRYLIDSCPQRRLAQAEEVAAAALYLASSRASFINGASIHVTGGLTDVPL